MMFTYVCLWDVDILLYANCPVVVLEENMHTAFSFSETRQITSREQAPANIGRL